MSKKIDKEVDKKYFIKRLNIIGGQIKGLSGMVESEREYEEVLIQLVAITNSLKTVGNKLIESYMKNNTSINKTQEMKDVMNLLNKLV